ncbi:MAG: cation:proton antiporter [Bryobacteraceae bacterium]|nr:cation:proton antiporter [Bryobacteraceae bacterium]
MPGAESAHDLSLLFIELGGAIAGLAVLARLASRWDFSPIPLYLLAGLAFGNGGLLPLGLSEDFIRVGGEIGVLLLLFMLGLEYTGAELHDKLRQGLPVGTADFLLNFTPGLIAGFLLGWSAFPAILLGGVTWISSSGIIARVLAEQQHLNNPETPAILTVIVLEDLAMAIYLPVIAVLLRGGNAATITVSVSIALVTVALILYVALRHGGAISQALAHSSDEVVLLSTFGPVLLVAGLAQRLHVSSAVGAFLAGVTLSGPIVHQSRRLLAPLRDLFAATFFFFFGLQIDPATLPPVALPAIALGLGTALTKILTGYWAAGRICDDKRARLRAGCVLVARGEFSIVIAGLGTAIEPRLGPFAGAYVLFLAVFGPLLPRLIR